MNSDCLENINPPSLFNEVTQMDETTMEAHTLGNETMCTENVFDERIESPANDTDEAITPIPSENCSSVESTPKKRWLKNRLTPKQKRQLAKERYKTYTIAAGRVQKEQSENNTNISQKILAGKCSPFSKLTPKQRRQEHRARFQTQVLDSPILNVCNNNENNSTESSQSEKPSNKTSTRSLVKSGIP